MNGTQLSPPERPTRVRWLIFILACAASWLLYLHRYSWGVIKPFFRREYPELTATELGWLDSAFLATYAIGQIPGGLAGDYFGARIVLTVIILLWSAAVVGVTWTGKFAGLFGLRSAFGLAQAGAYPVLSKVTRNWFPVAIRTSMQGVMTALGRVGAACSSLIIATLLMGMLELSWRTALFVIAVPGVLLAVAFWLVVRNSPREHPWSNQAEQTVVDPGMFAPVFSAVDPGSSQAEQGEGRGGAEAALMAGGITVAASPPQWQGVSGAGGALALRGKSDTLLLDRASLFSLGMVLLYAFASTFQDQLYVFWIPSFLIEGKGLNDQEMGLFTPLPLLGGAVGGIFGGMLNDYLIRRTGNRRWARSSIGFTGKMVAASLIVLSAQMSDGRLAMVVLLAARCFGDWSLPTQWGTITDMAGRASGTIFGLVNMVGAVGGFMAGPVLGYLKQQYGWEGLFLGAAAMCVVSALTWLFIDCTRRLVVD